MLRRNSSVFEEFYFLYAMFLQNTIREENITKLIKGVYWPYCVYKHTFPNNKQYVGITGKDPKIRWNNGKGYKNNILMYNDILLYGWDNIEHNIIKSYLCEYDALKLEKELIESNDLLNPSKGYNKEVSFLPFTNRPLTIILNSDIGILININTKYYDYLHNTSIKVDNYLAISLAQLFTSLLCEPSLFNVENREQLILDFSVNQVIKNKYVDTMKIFKFLYSKTLAIKWLTTDVCKIIKCG